MTVSQIFLPLYRPVPNPQADPSLPRAIWYAAVVLAGDVTGGGSVLIVQLAGTISGSRAGQSWSLERSVPWNSSGAAVFVRVSAQGLDQQGVGLREGIVKQFSQELVATTTAGTRPLVRADQMHPKLFLGSQADQTIPCSVQLEQLNVNGVSSAWYVTGYEWGPAARMNGWRRPTDGLLS